MSQVARTARTDIAAQLIRTPHCHVWADLAACCKNYSTYFRRHYLAFVSILFSVVPPQNGTSLVACRVGGSCGWRGGSQIEQIGS